MNAVEALEALSLIDLPAPRRAYIARLAVSATPAERRRIVYRARAEADAAQEAARAAWKREMAERATYRAGSAKAAQNGSQGRTEANRPMGRKWPEPRPVTVKFVEPTKPDATIPRRREGIGMNRSVRPIELPSGMMHGSHSAYTRGCRCVECRAAKARYQREWRERQQRS